MIDLNSQQRRHLRQLGHPLKPIVRTGQAGLSDAVIAEVDVALRDHELVKVKLAHGDRDQRRHDAAALASAASAALAQSIGQTILLYRPNPEKKRRIALP